jgi:hypothetical protein
MAAKPEGDSSGGPSGVRRAADVNPNSGANAISTTMSRQAIDGFGRY